MVAIQHLENAPVVEGLIDFRVRPGDGISLGALENLGRAIEDRYPVRKEAKRFHSSIEVKDGAQASNSITSELIGYRFERSDARSIVQVQLGGFSLSHLAPYDAWESLIADAQVIWKEYQDIVKPSRVVRVATRFINRIELPLSGELDFDEFLSVGPRVPQGLAQNVGEFLTRIAVADPKSGATVVVIQALESFNPKNSTLPVLLDIDVFKDVEFDPDSLDHWKLLSELRHLKNQAFFSSITDKTLGLIK